MPNLTPTELAACARFEADIADALKDEPEDAAVKMTRAITSQIKLFVSDLGIELLELVGK